MTVPQNAAATYIKSDGKPIKIAKEHIFKCQKPLSNELTSKKYIIDYFYSRQCSVGLFVELF